MQSLYHSARKSCSNSVLFKNKIQITDKLMAWNGYPKCIRKSIFHNIDSNLHKTKPTSNDEIEMKKIWIRFPYIGGNGEILIKSSTKRLRKTLKRR